MTTPTLDDLKPGVLLRQESPQFPNEIWTVGPRFPYPPHEWSLRNGRGETRFTDPTDPANRYSLVGLPSPTRS